MRVRYEAVRDAGTWKVWLLDPAQSWLVGEIYAVGDSFSARPRCWTWDRVLRGFPRKRDAASFCAIAAGFAKKSPPRRAAPGNCSAAGGHDPADRA